MLQDASFRYGTLGGEDVEGGLSKGLMKDLRNGVGYCYRAA